MTPALQLRGITRRIGRTEVLRGVDLALSPGECVALIGPNGAGKSSLFDVASGRVAPTAGQVLLHGRDVTGQPAQHRRRLGLGRSFQISQLFASMSARDHLRCAALAPQARSLSWLRPFHWLAAVESQTDAMLQAIGLADVADQPVHSLSYARQRALEVGLAFCGDPSVVLLDEPTAGMSRDETVACMALIRRLGAGRTLLVVEHDMDVVFGLADRIAVLAQGMLLAFDTPAAVRADAAVQQAYLGELPC